MASVEKLESHEFLGINQIPSQLMEAGCETLHSEIHKLMDSIWSKEELPQQWKECVISVYRMSVTADCSNYQGIVLLLTMYKMSQHLLLRLTPYADRIYGGQPVDFGLIELLLVGFSVFVICWLKT